MVTHSLKMQEIGKKYNGMHNCLTSKFLDVKQRFAFSRNLNQRKDCTMKISIKEAALAQWILDKLAENKLTSGQTIEVDVNNGEVLLTGWVDNDEQKYIAKQIATGTFGCRIIVDNIRVRAPIERT